MYKKIIFSIAALVLAATFPAHSKDFKLGSPSGELQLTVSVTDSTRYSLTVNGVTVLKNCPIALTLEDGTTLGVGSRVSKSARGSRSEIIDAPFYRQASFQADYNYLRLRFEGDYILQFRAYNDGVAYRFVTSFPAETVVKDELVQFNFTGDYPMVIPMVPKRSDRYETSFEATYTDTNLGEAGSEDLAFLPLVVKVPNLGNIMLMESDLEDYPGMFVKQDGRSIKAEFPPIPSGYKPNAARQVPRPTGYSGIIARTRGSRSYPWRIVAYAHDDRELPTNNMVYQTASPSRLDDLSWIKPGLSTWDWWNAVNLHGVNFRAGINTATYKFDIDFAAKYGLQYILIDDGWYKDQNPLLQIDDIDINDICDHAREAGVGVFLWMDWPSFLGQSEEICERYSKLGVAGFKIDFFDGQNQDIVKDVYRIAEITSRYKLMLDLHGIYKPTGLNRTYPNVLNFEGVYGLENCKWVDMNVDMPANQVTFPYLRMASGPLDFTQGAMRNGSKEEYGKNYTHPMGMGTRAAQVAMYVVYDSPLAMLCDSPSEYLEDVPTLEYIASIPTVFDNTKTVDGEIGEYIVTRRQKGEEYYIGGLTNWTPRDISLSFDFLPEGQWNVSVYRDGVNADRVGKDHVIETYVVNSSSSATIHLAPAGGFAIKLTQAASHGSAPDGPADSSLSLE